MFGLGGGGSTSSRVAPWRPAVPVLRESIERTGELYNQDPWGAYSGPTVADISDIEQGAYNNASQFYQDGWGGRAINQFMDQGSNMARSGFGSASNHWQNALNQGPIQQGYANQGYIDLASANAYANNPYLDQQIDAASRDVTRNLYENQMPGIAAYSAGSGNLGSSRRGMMEGIAQRGAADRIADISAGMRGNAYSQGLNYGAQQAAANAQYQNQAMANNAMYGMQNRNMQMQAAQGLFGMGQQGQNMFNQGYGMFGDWQGQQQQFGGLQRNLAQQQMLSDQERYYIGQERPYQQIYYANNAIMPMSSTFGHGRQSGGGSNMLGSLLGAGATLGAGWMMR